MTNTAKRKDRRRLIVGIGAIAVIGYAGVKSGWVRGLLPQQDLPFQDMASPAGFRQLSGGAVTGGLGPLIGLTQDIPPALRRAERDVAGDICAALFEQNPAAGGAVPVAYFFDYQCPICRRLTPRLRALEGVQISWHDLAALGPASETAARASIAARAQGAYDVFHDRLMRARFQPNQGYVQLVAESAGVDAERLLADMQSDAVSRQLWRSRATANAFGMLGTPGLVVGRTAVIGDISSSDLARLVAIERDDPAGCG